MLLYKSLHMKNKIFKLVFTVWVIIWIFLLIREMFAKGNIREYNALLHRSLEGKRAYVTGDRLYEFLAFCNAELPEGAKYMFFGLEEDSHDKRRATYYLYPHLEAEEADFLLMFNEPILSRTGYEIISKLDDTRYILKDLKRRGR